MGNPYLVMGVALAALVVFMFLVMLGKRYKRCPSNAILVIYGKIRKGDSAKCIHGGAAFVLPLLQDYAYLHLEPIQIEIPLKDALSMENIRISVPSVFTVAIGTEPQIMQNAAIRLLGLDTVAIKKQAEDIIFGQLRQVIASMKIDDINRDREKFLASIQHSLEPELRKIGLVLINVNIKDITDESGYIEAIGKKAASEAIQRARGDVAEEQKKGEIRVAEAERDKMVSVALAGKDREIGVRDAQREQAVRVAEMQKEQAVGEQRAGFERDTQVRLSERDMRIAVANASKEQAVGEQQAAFERDVQVKAAERDMRVSVAEANARAIEGENQSKAAIANANATLRFKEAEALQLGESRMEEAKAAVIEAKAKALAKAALAEAERIEAERRAELEAPAKAEKAQTIVEAEAAAEKMRIEAEGEASAIFAKLAAEARGQYEILAKKGQGLGEIVQAVGDPQSAFQLLLLEQLDTLAKTSAQAISNIKFDKVIVWENGGADGAGSTSKFLSNLAGTLPPMLQVLKEIGGVEIPESLIRVRGTDASSPHAASGGAPPANPPAEGGGI
ncbi:MAG: flotillin family protein [Candidatus Omnitrophica bacterium]|nr:Inner membrane protein YqiK [bacterium]NUN97769.1 flotillin family protein [Candidatus Omnitrophota bacterium]